MANLNSLHQQSIGNEDKIEQSIEELEKSKDNYPSQSDSSTFLLILYAVITMSIMIFLLR